MGSLKVRIVLEERWLVRKLSTPCSLLTATSASSEGRVAFTGYNLSGVNAITIVTWGKQKKKKFVGNTLLYTAQCITSLQQTWIAVMISVCYKRIVNNPNTVTTDTFMES